MPNKDLQIELLRTFVTVVELGGFTQAGDFLGKSQPTISLQIQRLEQLVGQLIFVRNGRQQMLTPAGERLLDYARKIIHLNDEALFEFDTSNVSGNLHFGMPSEFASTVLPRMIGRFSKSYPGIRLEVTSELSKTLQSPTMKKKFDLILALNESPEKHKNDQIRVDELVWVGSPNTPFPSLSPIPLVVAPQGCMYRKRAEKILSEAQQQWRIVYTIPDLMGIKSAVEAGLGLTILTRSTVPEGLNIIKPTEKLPKLGNIGINLIYQKNSKKTALHRLVEYVKASLA